MARYLLTRRHFNSATFFAALTAAAALLIVPASSKEEIFKEKGKPETYFHCSVYSVYGSQPYHHLFFKLKQPFDQTEPSISRIFYLFIFKSEQTHKQQLSHFSAYKTTLNNALSAFPEKGVGMLAVSFLRSSKLFHFLLPFR